jgi:hypothetical protein
MPPNPPPPEFCTTCSATIVWMPSDEHPRGGQWVDMQGRPKGPQLAPVPGHTHAPENRS